MEHDGEDIELSDGEDSEDLLSDLDCGAGSKMIMSDLCLSQFTLWGCVTGEHAGFGCDFIVR